MAIPLVGQSYSGAGGSPYLRLGANLVSRPTAVFYGATINISLGKEDADATKTQLSEGTVPLESLKEDAPRGIPIRGYLGSALRELVRISERIDELKDFIVKAELGTVARASYIDELNETTTAYERIVTSEPFTQALESALAIQHALKSGSISRRSLNSANGLLGDQFLDLAATGSYGAISSITEGLAKLSEFSGQTLLEDDTAASRVSELGRTLIRTLHSAVEPVESADQVEVAKAVPLIDAPEFTEHNFKSAGDLAISIRSYEGKDLLRAVAGGFVERAEDLYQLTIRAADDDEEDDEEQLERGAKRLDEQRTAQRDGLKLEGPAKAKDGVENGKAASSE